MARLGCNEPWDVLPQDRQLERPEGRPGLQAQLLVEDASCALIGGQGIRLALCAVQSEHQLSPEPLAVRVATDEGLEFIDELGTGAAGEVGIDPRFEGEQM